MNKDLEIIKNNAEIINVDPNCDTHHDKQTDKILAAAERMAAEIERLKKIIHLCDYCQKEYPTCDAPKDIDFGRGKGNDNVVRCAAFVNGRNLWAEIARLKAELEKRPEVIYCGTCKYYVPNENFCNAGLLGEVSPFDFCFRGQRRESEEINENLRRL